VDGKEKIIETHSTTIGEVLDEQDIKLRKEDKVNPSLNTEVRDNMTIKLDLATKVILSIDNKEKEVWTTADTVEELLQEQKVALHSSDHVKPEINAEIKKGMKISINKAFPVKYTDGEIDTAVWTASATVADFLKEKKIALGELDRVEPKAETELTKNMSIKVFRVEKAIDVVEEQTDFATVTKKDSSLRAGTEKVVQEGEKGLVKNHFEVVKENGKEVSRKLIKRETVKKPKNRIISVGTKAIKKQVSRGTTISAGREFYVTATAYTAYCFGCTGETATGIDLRSNPNAKVIAVDPSVIPLGSKVWVEGYGYAIAADTGGAIKGNRIDVFVPSESQANQFGRKTVRIKILD